MNFIKFFNFSLFSGSSEELTADLQQHISRGDNAVCEYVSCLNPHSFSVSRTNAAFSLALSKARWLIPDGIGCIVGARILGKQCAERIAGFDVFKQLSEVLNVEKDKSVFFLGSTEETLQILSKKYSLDFKNITIAGVYSPPFLEKFDGAEKEKIISIINSSGADVIWVGLSSPKQDIWMSENVEFLNSSLALGIGAVFDFYVGNVKRSPKWIQLLGFEWLHRLVQEPKRLWRRTFVSGPIFAVLLLKEFWNVKIRVK